MFVRNSTYDSLKIKHNEECNKNKKLNKELSKLKNENQYNEEQMKYQINEKNKLNKELLILKNKYNEIELKLKDSNSKNTTMSLKELQKLKIKHPQFQRPIMDERVNKLYEAISTNPNFIIPLYIGKIKKEYYIIDGQHRLKALNRFKTFENINVKIIEVNNHKQLREYFLLINDSLKLPEIYKEDDPTKLQIIKETFLYLKKKYPSYFKIGNASRPAFNVEIFHNVLQHSNIIKEKNIKKSQQLIDMIERLNKKYENRYSTLNPRGFKGLKSIQSREKKGIPGLYLRISPRWLEHLKDEDFNQDKEIITQKMRDFIWKINYGDRNKTLCICCKQTEIRNDYFECGHIISECEDGTTNHYNLKPICGNCNRKMSTKRMFEYMLDKNINKELALNMKSLYLSNTYLFQKS